jgi:hypothetical protein
MDYILVAVAVILLIIGILGCILPVIPGPPLSFAGLLLSHFTRWGQIELNLLLWLAFAAAAATVLDYVLPVWATKKFGGSKRGVWGAAIGLVIGIFFFPPIGIIVGPFLGALLGELSSKDSENKKKAYKSAFGSFIGFLLGTGLKFAVSGIITYYFVVETFIR